jgi:hypothetical protein
MTPVIDERQSLWTARTLAHLQFVRASPVGHSNPHGPFLEHYRHGPLAKTRPTGSVGAVLLGMGKPRLNLIRRKFAPLQKLKHHRGSSPTSSELRRRSGHDDNNNRFLTVTSNQHDSPAST